MRMLRRTPSSSSSPYPYPFPTPPAAALELAVIVAEGGEGHDRETVTTVLAELRRWHATDRRALCDRMVCLLAVMFWGRDQGGRMLVLRTTLERGAHRM